MQVIGSLKAIALCLIVISVLLPANAQEKAEVKTDTGPVLWEPVDIPSRNLLLGPTSEGITPALEKVTFLGRQPGGNNLKYRIKDANGREWVVKIADESRAEVAAVRLLWAIGYRTEIDQIVKRLNIEKIGSYKNARFEARPETRKRGERWSWTKNPFGGTREFNGLKLMMALVNNWDLKDENNLIVEEDGKNFYIVSDLGSSFGKLADKSSSRSGRSVSKPEDFHESGFIKGGENGVLVLDYRGAGEGLMQGIPVEHGRWLADLLLQLKGEQIADAFRAANYSPEEVSTLTAAIKGRINALDQATKTGTVSTN
jgi:hypothetical protein